MRFGFSVIYLFVLAAVQGIQGLFGIQGYNGYQGLAGEAAAQGSQGNIGTQGVTGIQGPYGYQGIQGIAGIQGGESSQGTQGLLGLQGIQGIQGRVSFNWIGNWSDTILYNKDDVVYISGSSFVCNITHTSSSDFTTDYLLNYWNLMALGGIAGPPGSGIVELTGGTGIEIFPIDPFADVPNYLINTSALISNTSGISGSSKINNIVSLNQIDYDSIVTKDSGTLYIVIS